MQQLGDEQRVGVEAATGRGGNVRAATGLYPNSIFPLASPADVANASYISIEDFQYLLWRPLYWFGNNGQPGYNAALSLANVPVYSNGGKTVTITLKHNIHWSDGKLLTSRDVELWMNMLIANRTDYFNYSPGYIPDNLVSESYPADTPYTFSLTFNKAYSHTWLLYNQLSEIIPCAAARLGQDVDDRSRGELRHHDQGCASGLELPERAERQAVNVREQPAVGRRRDRGS